MPSDLTGKVYVVTGAASGIGLATSKTLLSRGASVTLVDLNGTALSAAVSSLPADQRSRALARTADVTERAEVAAALAATKRAYGRVSGVASNAGTGGRHLGFEEVWRTSDAEYDFIMGVNVRGAFNVLSEALRPGVLDEQADGGSSVVHVGSMFSERGFKNGAVFSASKHATVGLVKGAALEAAGRGIRVNTVLPGAIDTPMHRANLERWGDTPVPSNPLGRDGQAQEVANVIVFLLSDESGYVTGSAWGVDGGANA